MERFLAVALAVTKEGVKRVVMEFSIVVDPFLVVAQRHISMETDNVATERFARN